MGENQLDHMIKATTMNNTHCTTGIQIITVTRSCDAHMTFTMPTVNLQML